MQGDVQFTDDAFEGLVLTTLRWFVLCAFRSSFVETEADGILKDRGSIHASTVLYKRTSIVFLRDHLALIQS